MNGFSSNFSHIKERQTERLSQYKAEVDKKITGLLAKMKARKMPNCEWQSPIQSGGKTIGFVLGQGNWISTVIDSNKSPRGVKV